MFCSHCGKELKGDPTFCKYCGATLEPDEPEEEASQVSRSGYTISTAAYQDTKAISGKREEEQKPENSVSKEKQTEIKPVAKPKPAPKPEPEPTPEPEFEEEEIYEDEEIYEEEIYEEDFVEEGTEEEEYYEEEYYEEDVAYSDNMEGTEDSVQTEAEELGLKNPETDPYWDDIIPQIDEEIHRIPKDIIVKGGIIAVALVFVIIFMIYMLS